LAKQGIRIGDIVLPRDEFFDRDRADAQRADLFDRFLDHGATMLRVDGAEPATGATSRQMTISS
jgi:hypothetical protein